MQRIIETDYLVVGAGASGMAFTDALIEQSDAEVVLVDRRHRPGGHWNDAYPFVRLHQPSACYGVNSLPLGSDRIDRKGPNAGFYERATGSEMCHYYERVLDGRLLPSGQVRFLGMCDYLGVDEDGHRVVSRVTGEETLVRVRRRLVDASYLEGAVPARHTPPFDIEQDTRVVSPGRLVNLASIGPRITVFGAGKTAMDTCSWLLDHGVDPERIRWIRPRDSWVLDRAVVQPLALLPAFLVGVANEVESAALADDIDDLFRRLEEHGQLHRLDRDVRPGVYRAAILSEAERTALRQIRDVVRLGRVRRLGRDRIVLDGGEVRAQPGEVHVDCTARGLGRRSARPIFAHGRITVQSIQFGIVPFSAALIGYVEATRDDDVDKNRLCPPNRHADAAADWIPTTATLYRAKAEWDTEPEIQAWLEASRLNIARGVRDHLADSRVPAALDRIATYQEQAVTNLARLGEMAVPVREPTRSTA